jgi:hypothetical protein
MTETVRPELLRFEKSFDSEVFQPISVAPEPLSLMRLQVRLTVQFRQALS